MKLILCRDGIAGLLALICALAVFLATALDGPHEPVRQAALASASVAP